MIVCECFPSCDECGETNNDLTCDTKATAWEAAKDNDWKMVYYKNSHGKRCRGHLCPQCHEKWKRGELVWVL